jgi:hypothetical protein
MPVNGLTIGNDCSLVINDSTQGLQTFTNITMVNFAQIVQSIKSVGLNGVVKYADLPEGWSASLKIDAGSGALMDYFATANTVYLASGQMGVITLQQTVTWADGSTSTYLYEGGAIQLTDAGQFAGNEKVAQSCAMKFASVQKVA